MKMSDVFSLPVTVTDHGIMVRASPTQPMCENCGPVDQNLMIERAINCHDDLVAELSRTCDNLAFLLNHADIPAEWYDKFSIELERARAALSKATEVKG